MSIVRFETDVHTTVQALLPWYATRQLDADDLALVESHLAGCERCRAELGVETQLRALQAEAPTGPLPDVDRGWQTLHAQIAADERRARPPAAWRWLRWALGAETVLVAALAGALLWPQSRPAPGGEVYRALGAPAASRAADAIVMFSPDATEAQIRAALQAIGARIVGGPTSTHGYLLGLPSGGRAATIATLRRQPGVTLAESLDATP
ncbi:MAG: zf-HC2 domain-containing protein [Proteobacteria bacterium]|nr:zf-HC2 domain-containing protein [Pseudomonadota bacterium]